MKRLNKNVAVFIAATIIVICGMASKGFVIGLKDTAYGFFANIRTNGIFDSFSNFASGVERSASQNLRYHNSLVDINSVFNSAIGTRIITKDDMVVVKADNGYLSNTRYVIPDNVLSYRVSKVKELQEKSEKSGAEFMYIIAPTKGHDLQYAPNIEDYTEFNCERLADFLKKDDIPTLNLIDSMHEDGITEEEMFFITDHHWKPSGALWATDKILSELNSRYGYTYDKDKTDISNYNIKTYENWFLGSQGKKAGRYFTPLGVDDFDIITPKFKTHLTEEQPFKDHFREGSFIDTVMYMENADTKDHYTKNPYAAYSGGDFREQIITNKLNPDGRKILIVRDSYACALVPFLSLNAGSVHAVDVRSDSMYVGGKINVHEYIDKIKPDYVFVFYSGAPLGDDVYNFD